MANATLMAALSIMGKGMGGIFTVMVLLAVCILLLGKLTGKK